MYNKTNKKGIGRKKSHCLWQNCKKSIEWNGIYKKKKKEKKKENKQKHTNRTKLG